ncbi:uncharacterized protein SCHCODRAFT_02624410 [Schizophyllum commune H4-8]|nr:uncharacterized protein SCHCODRAFT_02624410 [Schizophyllum commune H4-8]KAI5894345.1 hypothetical protein SCHCODRAFT_02624410 [Schizophyllum commune H4-8]
MSAQSAFRRNLGHWFAVEAIPIYIIMGGAVTGAAWYASRLARAPHVVWSRENATPWNTIQPNQSPKMFNVNQEFESKWNRKLL